MLSPILQKSHDHAESFSQKMTNAEYHAHPAISKSSLDKIARSPAHYLEWKNNPPEQTKAMVFGSAVHEAILQPHIFRQNTVVLPELDKRTKAGKEAFEKFTIENHGKNVISPEEYQSIQGMIDSVYSHPSAGPLLTPGHAELSFFWKDFESGVECRCRPDFLREQRIIVDIKTTEDASLKAFQRSVNAFRYHVQAAFYLDGISEATGHEYDTFVLIAVEKSAPYAVAVYVLDEATIERGRELYKKNLETFSNCKKTNLWPAYSNDIQPLNLPAWAWGE